MQTNTVWRGGALLVACLMLATAHASALSMDMDAKMEDMKHDMESTFDEKFSDDGDTGTDDSRDTDSDRDTRDSDDQDTDERDQDDSTDRDTRDSDRSTDSDVNDLQLKMEQMKQELQSKFDGTSNDDSNDRDTRDSDDRNTDDSDRSDDRSGDRDTRDSDDSTDRDTRDSDDSDTGTDAPSSGSLAAQTEAALVDSVNAERQARGLHGWSFDSDLRETARHKSQDMAARDYFAHTAPDGTRFTDIFRQYGVSCGAAAENLAKTHKLRYSEDPQELADGITTLWMNSDGHRRAILRSYYDQVGYGVEITDGGTVYATMHAC